MSGKWHPYDPKKSGTEQGLLDHFYYLVTHRDYDTPLKAKWHAEGLWVVIGFTPQYVWDWYEDQPVIAWMELPDIYRP